MVCSFDSPETGGGILAALGGDGFQLLDALDKVVDPLDDCARVGWDFVERPSGGDHPTVQVGNDGPMVVGLLLFSLANLDDVTQVRADTLENLAA